MDSELTRQAQHERRKQAVRLLRRSVAIKDIAARWRWYKALCTASAKKDGLKALALKPTGDGVGQKRRLIAEQLRLTFALWSRAAVLLLVPQDFGIEQPIRTMGGYLKRCDFTPQKPITRAYEQRPEAVKAWLDEPYPAIAQCAKLEDAEIH